MPQGPRHRDVYFMTTANPPTALKLPAKLDYAACTALKAELLSGMETGLDLDASEVHFVGGMAAEILLSASKQCERDGKPFTISNASEECERGLGLLGLSADDYAQEVRA